VVPIGGGGLMAGVACAGEGAATWPCRVIAWNSRRPGMTPALAAGKPVPVARPHTLADGLTPPFVGEIPLRVAQLHVDEIVLVSEDDVALGMRALFERARLVVEGSGAAATAALLAKRVRLQPGAARRRHRLRQQRGPAERFAALYDPADQDAMSGRYANVAMSGQYPDVAMSERHANVAHERTKCEGAAMRKSP